MDKGGGSPDTRWGASLPRATPLSLAGLKRTTSGLLNRRKPPGVPWEDAMANDLRLNFTNIGAHERVASGGFVGGSRYQKKAGSGTPSPPSSGTPPASVTDDPMDGSGGQKTPSPPSSEPAPPEPPPSPPTEPPTAPSPPFEPPYSDDAGSNKSNDGEVAQSVPPPLVTTGSVRDNPFLRRDSKARLDAQSAAAVGKALRARCASPAFGSAVLRSASFPAEMANEDDDDLNPDAPQPPTLVGGGRSSSGASTHRNLAALRRAREARAGEVAPMPKPPRLPMPTTAHMRGVKGAVARERGNLLASTRRLYSGRSDGAVALADRQGSDDALLALPAPQGDELLASIIPGEPAVRVPSRKRQLCAQGHRLLRALPLWTLNGLTAVGIGMLLTDLNHADQLASWSAFGLFGIVLPLTLVWVIGRPHANTAAARASLEGAVPLSQAALHAFQLVVLTAFTLLAVALTVYTSSSRVQRWARCELPWLNPPGGGAGGLEDMLSDLDMWACGDSFFA